MQRISRAFFFTALFMLIPHSLLAWEFNMKGESVIRYRYWARTGANDIFGLMNSNVYLGVNHLLTYPSPLRDNPALSGFGVLAGENRFGSDMNFTDMRVTLYPKIVVNNAVSMEGSVNLTSLGLHSGGRPLGQWDTPGQFNQMAVPISNRPSAIDVPNTMVTVQWWRLNFRFPVFNLVIGYRPSSLAMGLWKSPCQRSSTSIGFSVPYGPLNFAFGPYLGRTATNWNQLSRTSGSTATYRKDDDRNYLGGFYGDIQYRSASVAIDLSSTAYKVESNQPVDNRQASGAPGPLTTVTQPEADRLVYELTLGVKYFKQSFFFNAEANYYSHYRSGLGATAIHGGTRYESLDSDVKAWIYGLETGFVAGPAKMSVSYARSTGDDPATRKDDEDSARGSTGLNDCVMRHWAFLMYYMYGSGTNWNAAGNGQPTNLHHLGARLDYAVASNLNLFAVNSWAWRDQANAYITAGDYSHTLQRFNNNTVASQKGLAGFDAPVSGLRAVPDNASFVGWEIDFGINWKIIENVTWNSVFALWQPGSWWSYAYPNTSEIYRRNGGTVPQAPKDQPGAVTGLGRSIDPLIAFQSDITVEF